MKINRLKTLFFRICQRKHFRSEVWDDYGSSAFLPIASDKTRQSKEYKQRPLSERVDRLRITWRGWSCQQIGPFRPFRRGRVKQFLKRKLLSLLVRGPLRKRLPYVLSMSSTFNFRCILGQVFLACRTSLLNKRYL